MFNRFNRRREKAFGKGRPRPMDRNAKVRIMFKARALARRLTKGKAYGALTAKHIAVLEALIWIFHNAVTGYCFPSYEAIAEKAACARSTVAEAIKALEMCGILTWCNRITRIRVKDDIFGWRWRVIRTSNAYEFTDFNKDARTAKSHNSDTFSSQSENPTGTIDQDIPKNNGKKECGQTEAELSPLERAIEKFQLAVEKKNR